MGAIFTNIFALFGSFSLASTSGLLSERSGTVNIAIDGQMILGGLTWLLLVQGPLAAMGPAAPFVAMLLAGLVAMIYSLILSLGTVTFLGDNIIVGTGLNMLAPAVSLIVIFAMTGQSSLGLGVDLQYSMGWAGQIDTTAIIYAIIAISLMVATLFVLNRTKWGLRLKTAGENPYSLAAAGVSVTRTRYIANLIGGFYSGLAGSMAMLTLTGSFVGSVNGMGFIALAILIFGRWTIWGNMIGTVIISVIMGMARSWDFFDTSMPKEIMQMLPFIIPLVVMVLMKLFYDDKGYGGAPKAAGIPFKKDAR